MDSDKAPELNPAADSPSAIKQLREGINKLNNLTQEQVANLILPLSRIETDLNNAYQRINTLRYKLEVAQKRAQTTEDRLKASSEYYENELEKSREKRLFDPKTTCYEEEPFWKEIVIPTLERAITNRRNRNRRSGWLVLWQIDIRNFKRTNDDLGHDAGDEVLRHFGPLLRSSVRFEQRADYPGRVGGDEFSVLMTQIDDVSSSLDAARRFQSIIAEFDWDKVLPELAQTYRPFADIGIACLRVASIEDTKISAEKICKTWYRRADKLMYQAKQRGDEIFLRCYNCDSDGEFVECEPDIYKLELNQDRRHQ